MSIDLDLVVRLRFFLQGTGLCIALHAYWPVVSLTSLFARRADKTQPVRVCPGRSGELHGAHEASRGAGLSYVTCSCAGALPQERLSALTEKPLAELVQTSTREDICALTEALNNVRIGRCLRATWCLLMLCPRRCCPVREVDGRVRAHRPRPSEECGR